MNVVSAFSIVLSYYGSTWLAMCHEYMAGGYCRFSDLASLGLFKCLFWAYFGLSRLALNDMPSYLVVFYYYDDFMESLDIRILSPFHLMVLMADSSSWGLALSHPLLWNIEDHD